MVQQISKKPCVNLLGLLMALTAVGVFGCGDRDGKLVHGEGAKLFIEAMKVRTHDEDKCLDLLEQSIAVLPTGTAYFHSGWIFAKRGDFDQAQQLVRAGLELDPQSGDLRWLAAELDKPEPKRSFKMPPSTRK